MGGFGNEAMRSALVGWVSPQFLLRGQVDATATWCAGWLGTLEYVDAVFLLHTST